MNDLYHDPAYKIGNKGRLNGALPGAHEHPYQGKQRIYDPEAIKKIGRAIPRNAE